MKRLSHTIGLLCLLVAAFVIVVPGIGAQDLKPEIANALAQGDTARAINLINQEIELDKSYHLNYYVLGRISFEREQYKQAADYFKTALDKKSKHWESLYYLGLSQIQLGQLDQAEKSFEEGIKKAKDEAHMFYDGMGLVMMQRGNYQEADRNFRQALIGHEDNALYHIHLGDANLASGVAPLAVIEYEKAVEADTLSSEVYFHWAEACLEMKDYTCAMDKLKLVLAKDTTHAKAWMRAGGIYFRAAMSSRTRTEREQRFKEAIGSYKRYLDLSGAQPDSSNVRVYFELAMSYTNLYGFEDAAEYYEKVLAIPMEPRDIYFYYGKSLFYVKQYDKAAEMLNKHLEWVTAQGEDYTSGVGMDEVYQLIGDSYYYRDPKDFASAIEYYKKSLDVNPEQPRVVQNIAVSYHSLKSYAQAIEYYQKRIDMGIDDKTSSIFKNAGYCALNIANSESGSAMGGMDDLDDIDEIDQGAPAIPEGGIDPNLNYYEVSVNYLVDYLKYDTTDLKVMEAVANTYLYQLADCAKGVSYFQQVLAKDPQNCDAKKSLGYAYFGGICTKNYDKALDYLLDAHRCVTSTKGECGDKSLTLWIAQAYHSRAAEKTSAKQNASADFKNAFDWYGKVLKCDPTNADAKKGQDDVRFEF